MDYNTFNVLENDKGDIVYLSSWKTCSDPPYYKFYAMIDDEKTELDGQEDWVVAYLKAFKFSYNKYILNKFCRDWQIVCMHLKYNKKIKTFNEIVQLKHFNLVDIKRIMLYFFSHVDKSVGFMNSIFKYYKKQIHRNLTHNNIIQYNENIREILMFLLTGKKYNMFNNINFQNIFINCECAECNLVKFKNI